MFTLKKLELEEGKDSMVPTGHESTLPDGILYNRDTGERKPLNSIQDIEIGCRVTLTSSTRYHVTSEIREIISKDKDKVVFKTQTSVYELTQSNDDDDDE